MKTVFLLLPVYSQVILSVPLDNKEGTRFRLKMKSFKDSWKDARLHVVNDISEHLLRVSENKVDLGLGKRLNDADVLKYARQLALFRRQKRCTDWSCVDSKATDSTPTVTTTTTPPPPAIQNSATEATTQTKSQATTSKTTNKSSNSGWKTGWPFKFPSFPNIRFPLPKLPKFPFSG